MSKKQYSFLVMLIAAALSVTIGIFVPEGNYTIPLAAFILAFLIIRMAKKKVNEVIEDERDVKIRQRSSRLAIMVFVLSYVAVGIILQALSRQNQVLEPFASFFLYSACALMILDAAFYYYFARKGD